MEKYFFAIFFCIGFSLSIYAQEHSTKIKTKDFDLTKKVLLAISKDYEVENSTHTLIEEDIINLTDGYVTSRKNSIYEYQLQHEFVYKYSKDYNSYDLEYQLLKNDKKDNESVTNYKLYVFKGVDFYFPSNANVKFNTSEVIELDYTLGNYNYSTKITEENQLIKVAQTSKYGINNLFYNKIGALVKSSFAEVTGTTYNYNTKGFISSGKIFTMYGNNTFKVFYEVDENNNWIKKLYVEYDGDKVVKQIYTGRYILYTNYAITGATEYDADFVKNKESKWGKSNTTTSKNNYTTTTTSKPNNATSTTVDASTRQKMIDYINKQMGTTGFRGYIYKGSPSSTFKARPEHSLDLKADMYVFNLTLKNANYCVKPMFSGYKKSCYTIQPFFNVVNNEIKINPKGATKSTVTFPGLKQQFSFQFFASNPKDFYIIIK